MPCGDNLRDLTARFGRHLDLSASTILPLAGHFVCCLHGSLERHRVVGVLLAFLVANASPVFEVKKISRHAGKTPDPNTRSRRGRSSRRPVRCSASEKTAGLGSKPRMATR